MNAAKIGRPRIEAPVQPASVRSIEQTTEPRAMVEPTERSMPPVRMTSVMPTATMPLLETWRKTSARLPGLRKMLMPRELTGEVAMPTARSAIRPQ